MPRENPRTRNASAAINQGVGKKRIEKNTFSISREPRKRQAKIWLMSAAKNPPSSPAEITLIEIEKS
jgi:hypothetical protein